MNRFGRGTFRGILAMNHRGFTMPEVLMVLAVIGLLAAVTVPNFQKYSQRMRQSEAKIQLTGICTAERNYAAENRTFTACVSKLGITAPPGSAYYVSGFHMLASQNNQCGVGATQNCLYYSWDEGAPIGNKCVATDTYTAATIRQNPAMALPTSANLGQVVGDVQRSTFTARAAGNISGKSIYDKWSIDQNCNLSNTQFGL